MYTEKMGLPLHVAGCCRRIARLWQAEDASGCGRTKGVRLGRGLGILGSHVAVQTIGAARAIVCMSACAWQHVRVTLAWHRLQFGTRLWYR